MKIAIGTINRAKVSAVGAVIPSIWKDAELVPVEVESGVSSMPMSDDEGIQGAVNRAKAALQLVKDAEYGIGLEGAVQENSHGMFLGGWVAIMDRKGTVGIGSSGKVRLPKELQKQINEGKELGPLTQSMMNDSKNEIRHSLGTAGVLTKGIYTRTDEFKDATKLALAPFVSPETYNVRKQKGGNEKGE